MIIAKLLVPSGAPDHASGGEIFSPTQFGLRCLSAQAFLTASWSLSFTAEEVSVSTSARAAPNDKTKTPANNKLPRTYFMMSSSRDNNRDIPDRQTFGGDFLSH